MWNAAVPELSVCERRCVSTRRSLALVIGAVLLSLATSQSVLGQRWPDEHLALPFAYHADFQLRPFYPLLRTVSGLQHEIPQELGLGKVEEPIHIFLFQKPSTYTKYVRKYFPTAPTRPALFIKQRGPGMVFARLGPELAVDLRHETTHAVLHSLLPMVPLWLDEGLGEYFEVPPSSRRTGNPHLPAVASHMRWGRTIRIEPLEALGDISEMSSVHYRDSWAWVHFMLHGPEGARATLRDYLRDIEAHVPPGDLSRRLQRNVPQLEKQFAAHFRAYRRNR